MTMMDYLKKAVERGASDLFFLAGKAVSVKIDGAIAPLDEGASSLSADDTDRIIAEIFDYSGRARPTGNFVDDDFSFSVPSLARFRVSIYRQRGSMAAVIRIVSFDIPDYKKIGVPESVMGISALTSGMVLFTGTAGSGKSTTQACIIDRINSNRSCHIITLEDPIEYLHRHKKSIVSQREISVDVEDYSSALRSSLRQSPDVILLGELRDAQTMYTAMTAAETGHLVIATLHTKGVVNAIDRIIDFFPSSQQSQIRVQLSSVLNTVVSQQLVPDKNGELFPAFELMYMNSAIKTLIRDNKNHQIDNVISSSSSEGMISMDQYLRQMVSEGKITREIALEYAADPEHLERMI